MADLGRYLLAPYLDRGRDLQGYDCWGLVRSVLHDEFGLPLLPAHDDVSPDDKPEMSCRYEEVSEGFEVVETPQPGDVMAAYSGNTLVHVGVVIEADGRLWVLHTRKKHGTRLDKPETLERLFTSVVWWRYAD